MGHQRAMSPDVPFFAALFGGLISFLSPCVLPLVPPFLVYLTGTSLEQMGEGGRSGVRTGGKARTAGVAAVFVAGFSTVFVALGASASVIGAVVRSYSYYLAMVAGVVIIVMGLHFLGVFRLPFLMRARQIEVDRPCGLWGAYVMGLAFGFGWTPCIGPVLAAILAVAASEATVARGAGLLAIYSLGLGIPFILAAFFVEPFARFMTRFRRHVGLVERIMGILLILTGIAFLTGSLTAFSFWLLETFPVLGRLG